MRPFIENHWRFYCRADSKKENEREKKKKLKTDRQERTDEWTDGTEIDCTEDNLSLLEKGLSSDVYIILHMHATGNNECGDRVHVV